MKKAIFLFMTLLMCCAFLSCSKDDDPALMTIAVTAVTITEGETYAAMEDVLSTTDVCRALLNLAVNGNKRKILINNGGTRKSIIE